MIFERYELKLVWATFLLSNLMSMILVFRSSPFLVNLGIIKRFFVGISSIAIPFVYIAFLILLALLSKHKNIFKHPGAKLFYLVVVIFGIVIIGSMFYFDFVDLMRYQNYTFSTYYIYLPSLKFYSYFQIIVFCTAFVSYWIANFNKWKNVVTMKNIFFLVIISFLPIMLLNILSDIPYQLKDELLIYHSYILSKDKSQTPDFELLKKELDFIVSNTEPNSTIIHPTQSNEFPLLGNQPLIRHGLFPRTLVSAKFAFEYLKLPRQNNVYYILSTYTDGKSKIKTTFPDYKIDSDGIKVLFLDGSIRNFKNKAYTIEFVNSLTGYDVGLIKLK